MLRRLLIALSFALPVAAVAQPMAPGMPRPGIDFEVLPIAQPTLSQVKGKIEVVEVFSYACGHCANFQPHITKWKSRLPADVNFIYLPSVGQGPWERLARGFYAAESFKIQARAHDALFQAIHVEHRLSHSTPVDEIADFYAAYGVNKNAFIEAMMSKPVSDKTEKSKIFTIRTGANSTPTIVIAGKYKINATQDRGFEGMIKTMDFIIAKERAAIKISKPKATAK